MHRHRRDIRCQTDSLRAARCALYFQSREHHSQTVLNAVQVEQFHSPMFGTLPNRRQQYLDIVA